MVVVVDGCVVVVLDVLDVVVGGTVDELVAVMVLVLVDEPPAGREDETGELLEAIGTVAEGSVPPLLSIPA